MGFFICYAVGLLLGFSVIDTEALLCYKCLNLDCPSDKVDCEGVREFVVKELRSYYYMDNYVPPCPKLNETLEWRLLQLNNVNCGELASGQATCSLGRLKITTLKTTEDERGKVVSHATVLGCANARLLTQVRDTLKAKFECDMHTINGTQGYIRHSVSMEHCSQPSDQCHGVDYCINPSESRVKTFKEKRQDTKFEYGIVVGILVVILVLFGAIVLGSMCSSPINRASNLPYSDEIDLMKNINAVPVLPTTSTSQLQAHRETNTRPTRPHTSTSHTPRFMSANSGRINSNSISTDIY